LPVIAGVGAAGVVAAMGAASLLAAGFGVGDFFVDFV